MPAITKPVKHVVTKTHTQTGVAEVLSSSDKAAAEAMLQHSALTTDRLPDNKTEDAGDASRQSDVNLLVSADGSGKDVTENSLSKEHGRASPRPDLSAGNSIDSIVNKGVRIEQGGNKFT